jgi:uncharacterized protein YbbC (DUF1343 family)
VKSTEPAIGWKRKAIVYGTTMVFVLGVPSLPNHRLHWLYWLGALLAEIAILAVVVWRRPRESN